MLSRGEGEEHPWLLEVAEVFVGGQLAGSEPDTREIGPVGASI
jgi:hypothetical protein